MQGFAISGAIVLALWGASLFGVAYAMGFARGGTGFNIVRWEVIRLITFAANRTAPADNGMASRTEVARYFDLHVRAVAAHQRWLSASNPADQAIAALEERKLRAQAETLRVPVEARLEDAVSTVARQAGLFEKLPVFGGITVVWPPVATGLSVPPHILIISPRNRIALKETQLLRGNLSDGQAAQVEQTAERSGVSADVEQIGGLGAYPSIVDEDDSPLRVMQTVAHEWMHDYLAFHPLGARYGVSNDMILINETVANMVGNELGLQAFALLNLPLSTPAPAKPAPALDFNQTMHNLRLEVDQLLEDGKVAEAERRMNETQQQLAAAGYSIRRINQAYFAFYGSYGDNAASSSPLGARVIVLRRLSRSVGDFVHAVERVANPADLDRILRNAAVASAPDTRTISQPAAAAR